MKILLANKFYYPRGGSDIYMIELEKLLKENGHEVEVFSMQHPLNLKSGKSGYFPGEVDLNKKTITSLAYSLLRPFGSKEVRRKYKQLLKEFKPDVVHLNNIHSHLSPILAVIAHRHKVPVVWALHDHKLLCPRYDCMRNNKPCELCFTHKYNVVRYRCMKNSLLASLIAYAEAIFWNKEIVSRSTNTFICPSTFLLKNMIKGGFDKNQLVVLNNFINLKKVTGNNFVRQNYYCYVGRLSTEKGIKTLLKAARELPQHILKVIGTGPLENSLKEEYKEKHIEFLGFREWNDLKEILGSSKVMVIPSECYENNPLSVIESLCLGTPVIGSNIGGIPELITPGKNGLIFETGNVSDLQNKISQIFQSALSFNYSEIEYKARNKFNSGNYYDQIINIYDKLIFSKN